MEDEMKRELSSINSKLDRVIKAVSNLTGKVADIEHTIATKVAMKTDLAPLERLASEVEASRRDRLIASDFAMSQHRRIDEHERRIARLEARRA